MTATANPGAMRAVIAACATLALLAGCSQAPPQKELSAYSHTLNKFYDGRPVCIWPDSVEFPVLNATPDQIGERGCEALTYAGLLVRKRAAKGAPAGSYSYYLSPEGRSAIDPDINDKDAGNFCYGRRRVAGIDDARENTPTTEVVDYSYTVANPASWATEHAIQSAFPQVASELSGPHKAEAILLDTTDGWQLTAIPSTVVPTATQAQPSALSKAKALLHLAKKQAS
jgi:hypothetical protein